jgi:probable addiction module antidote protein
MVSAYARGQVWTRASHCSTAPACGMMQLARETELTREGLCMALSPEGNPKFTTVIKVYRALGLKLHLHR